MGMTKLTQKQKRFIEEYLVDLNATQAAIRAGYKKTFAKEQGYGNLAKPYIQEAIQKAMDKRSQRTEVTQDKVLKELSLIGFSNMKDYVNFGPVGVTLKELAELPDSASKVISEVSHNFNAEGGGSIKFKLYDKQAALVNIGKHLGMFIERRETGRPGEFANLTEEELDRRIAEQENLVRIAPGKELPAITEPTKGIPPIH